MLEITADIDHGAHRVIVVFHDQKKTEGIDQSFGHGLSIFGRATAFVQRKQARTAHWYELLAPITQKTQASCNFAIW